jgi:hypothetical protein
MAFSLGEPSPSFHFIVSAIEISRTFNIMRFKIIELSATFKVQVIELADERAP